MPSLPEALSLSSGFPWVIGGGVLFKEAIRSCSEIYLTRIPGTFNCDTFFPPIGPNFALVQSRKGDACTFLHYVRHPEEQYLQLIQRVLQQEPRGDRTGVGTLSLFGPQLSFDLSTGLFPLFTTKRVFWRGVVEELLWFISGSTDATVLAKKGVHIWDANGSREALDKRGLTENREGDLGPVYGFQWRHWGAAYAGPDQEYKGCDQLAKCIEMIKEEPESRRIIMTAWNPLDLPKMALPPCHAFCQFYVDQGELSCHLYQRSADLGLGVPFNVASYALLVHLVAQVCDLAPGRLVMSFGDCHIYANHVEGLKEQLQRNLKSPPRISLAPLKDIDDFRAEHIELHEYTHHPTIKLPFAV